MEELYSLLERVNRLTQQLSRHFDPSAQPDTGRADGQAARSFADAAAADEMMELLFEINQRQYEIIGNQAGIIARQNEVIAYFQAIVEPAHPGALQ